jgi:hypothetical protein
MKKRNAADLPNIGYYPYGMASGGVCSSLLDDVSNPKIDYSVALVPLPHKKTVLTGRL